MPLNPQADPLSCQGVFFLVWNSGFCHEKIENSINLKGPIPLKMGFSAQDQKDILLKRDSGIYGLSF